MQVKTVPLEFFDMSVLDGLVKEKFLTVQKHPNLDLFIYNYSQQTQWSNNWNDITLQCRGLVLDNIGNVIARPFPKFFNFSQVEQKEIPVNEEFEVFEKMDGSLLVTFMYNAQQIFATRGSFASEQAIKAKEIWNNTISKNVELREGFTYLFEIIYPQNRIVVDYGTKEDLIALTVIENKTGKELPHEHLTQMFPSVVKKYSFTEKKKIEELFAEEKPNTEGFVIRFSSGFRCKVKFAEYCRLHKIMTGINNKNIWEFLKAGSDLNEVIKNVPDEVFDWFKKTERDLNDQYRVIEEECKKVFNDIPVEGDRKVKAQFITKHKNPHVLFAMLDKKEYAPLIWDLIKPKYCKPFKQDLEN